MLTGPRSLDQLSNYHTYCTEKASSKDPSGNKKHQRIEKVIDWEKQLDIIRERMDPKDNTRMIDITVRIGRIESIEHVFPVVKGVLSDTEKILEYPEPEVLVADIGSSDISINIRPYCFKDDYWEAMGNFIKKLKMTLFQAGIAYKSVRSNA